MPISLEENWENGVKNLDSIAMFDMSTRQQNCISQAMLKDCRHAALVMGMPGRKCAWGPVRENLMAICFKRLDPPC